MRVEDGRKKGEGGERKRGGKKHVYRRCSVRGVAFCGCNEFLPLHHPLPLSIPLYFFLSPPAARIFVEDLYNTTVRPACVDSCAGGIYIGSYRKINCRVALDPRQKKVETGVLGTASRSRLEDE